MFIVAYLQQWSDVVSEYRSKYVLKWNVKALYTCIVTLWSLLWTSVIPSIQKHYYDGDIESLSDFVYVPEQNHCKNITWWPVHLKSIITGISCHRWLWTLFKWHFNGSRWAGEPKCSVTRLKNDIEECILIFSTIGYRSHCIFTCLENLIVWLFGRIYNIDSFYVGTYKHSGINLLRFCRVSVFCPVTLVLLIHE